MTSRTQNPGSTKATVEINRFLTENTSLHHTNEYENKSLVLRRGGKFKLELTFQGVQLSEILEAFIRFTFDSKVVDASMFSKICKIEQSVNDSNWEMAIVNQDEENLKLVVEINIPVNAMVGRYNVDVILPSSPSTSLKRLGIIILFNPWNEDDEVYLADEELRTEYVLNDTGIIYRGNVNDITEKHWNFGQFEENVLDCVLLLLQKERKRNRKFFVKTLSKLSSAVWISRRLSAVLNMHDEDGLLVGDWSGDWGNHVPPYAWDGSVEIFGEYFNTKKPVKYGQCWVFSGVMTTALRALGIPSRSVTNFLSAHDVDATMTIDVFFGEEAGYIPNLSRDSVWNYHVWNEIWIKRNDLPGDSYDGWQAVDATPQEVSMKLFQMGPAPVKAVKEGEVYAGYDTGFVFAEVNSDYVKWIVKKNEKDVYVVARMGGNITDHIGKYISTKKPGKDEREDITHLYKYTEKTAEERKAFATAYSFGKGPEKWMGELNIEEEGKDITIGLSTNPEAIIPNGESFSCIIKIENTSNVPVTVDLTGVINSVIYTGETKNLIKREKMTGIVIETGKSETREIGLKPEEYLGKLTDMKCCKLVVVAKVQETGKQYVDDLTFHLTNKACIAIEFPTTPLKVGQKSKVSVTFTNTLPISLSHIKMTVEGAGLTKALKTPLSGVLVHGKSKVVNFDITPKKAGLRKLLVDVDSKQVKDFKSFATVNVVS